MGGLLLGAGCVVALNAYATALVLLRATVFRTRVYRPMLLNIGLSLLPLVVALGLVVGALVLAAGLDRFEVAVGPAVLWGFVVVTAAIWVLFFPNSMYLITELNLSHRRAGDRVPLWFDIVQTLTLCLSGVANAIAGLGLVQLFSVLLFDDPNRSDPTVPAGSWVVAAAVIVLGSLGVYLGRYLRFNSWDVRHPGSMLRKTTAYFSTPSKAADLAGFVLTHSLLIGILYVPLFAGAYGLLLSR